MSEIIGTQKTRMSCGAHLIEHVMDQLQNFHNTKEEEIIDEVIGIEKIGMTPSKFEELLNKYSKPAGYESERQWNTTRDDVRDSLENWLQIPCLIVEDSSKNPHTSGEQKSIYNLHYVSIVWLEGDQITLKNPFHRELETITIEEFEKKWSFENIPLSAKAKIFKKLGNIKPNTSFILKEVELKLPFVLDLVTNETEKWREFKDWLYLKNDWKKAIIEKSIEEWTLWIWATDIHTREAVYNNLMSSPKEKVAITLWTWGQFWRIQYRELMAANQRLEKSWKELVQLNWW